MVEGEPELTVHGCEAGDVRARRSRQCPDGGPRSSRPAGEYLNLTAGDAGWHDGDVQVSGAGVTGKLNPLVVLGVGRCDLRLRPGPRGPAHPDGDTATVGGRLVGEHGNSAVWQP